MANVDNRPLLILATIIGLGAILIVVMTGPNERSPHSESSTSVASRRTTVDSDREWPVVGSVESQPLLAQVRRVVETLERIGSPLSTDDRKALDSLTLAHDDRHIARRVQGLLDRHCLAAVSVDEQARITAVPNPGRRELVEQGWRAFLVKVVNRAGLQSRLSVRSPHALPLPYATSPQLADRWLALSTFDGQPLSATLSGLELEYRIVEVFNRDVGRRTATLEFVVPGSRTMRQTDVPGPRASSSPTNDSPTNATRANDSPSSILHWTFERDSGGWRAMNDSTVEARDGALWIRGTGNDPYVGTTLERSPGRGRMTLRFWGRSDEPGTGQVFWWTNSRPHADGDHFESFTLEAGRERLYEIPFAGDGDLVGLRIDPNVVPGTLRIDWIELVPGEVEDIAAAATVRFDARPAIPVTLRIVGDPAQPAVASFEITDAEGRVYPPPMKRLAPDFFFQRQIYRANGETLRLPPGRYSVTCRRGPESIPETKKLAVDDRPVELEYRVRRWIDPSSYGYWSGDHHIHAAGCAHYDNPTQGVRPEDMLRHCMGEDLKVGCCLTWGPCFEHQSQFFSGQVDARSRYPYLLRYDVEVSGFGSQASGHLNLLRLREQFPPNVRGKSDWPTLGLNTLRWAKRQGAVCGPAHSALGLTRVVDRVPDTAGLDGPEGLPTFDIPAFDGVGANEFIMNVTHELPGPDGRLIPAVDFISTMNTDRRAEWNMWYHVLNCGFRTKASGETDFPCISGERVGMGRVYAKVPGRLNFDGWCDAVAAGRSYVSDGSAHLINFTAHERELAVEVGDSLSELNLPTAASVRFTVTVAMRREDGEHARVELVKNGYPIAERTVTTDGQPRELAFTAEVDRSAWFAIRTFPSAHSNPIFVIVGGKPVRANRNSAEWCWRCVEQCWRSKRATYRAEELEQAERDFEHARRVFRGIRDECQATPSGS